ncbi:class F sortase [Patescibacteria group bacterium]|nr:class F sortase [Patescibacteria group bacterium]
MFPKLNYIQKQKIEEFLFSKRVGLLTVGLIGIFFASFLLSLTVASTFLYKIIPGRTDVVDAVQLVPLDSVFAQELKPIYGDPVELKINSVNIAVKVGPVGVAKDGSMETPVDWNGSGWYFKSARPGELGNLVINAHYDRPGGAPAAFYGLKNAKINDKLQVEDSFGRVYEYMITDLSYVDMNDPTRLQVLEDKEGASTITMLTCSGVWIPSEGTYSKRLVVTGTLVQEL